MRTDLYRERFMSRIEKTEGCWLWRGHVGPRGYGTACHFGERRAHRIMYHFAYGGIPDGLQVLHHCDTPACVRPDHLFVGTITDNMLDCSRKGRRRKRLSEADVIWIRQLLVETDMPLSQIAALAGCSLHCVSVIKLGRTWQYLGGPIERRDMRFKGTAEKVGV